MKKILLGAVGAAIAVSAVPASAAIVLCEGASCVRTDENVQVNPGTGATLTGNTNQTNATVNFSSTLEASLVGPSAGQSRVEAGDGLLSSLTFSLQSGFGFSSAEFNLSPLPGNVVNEAANVLFSITTTTGTQTFTRSISDNGSNFFGITGNAGEIFTSITFTAVPGTTGIADLRQLRLGDVQALSTTAPVPEPSTWAMMLLGMLGIGATMRTRRHNGVKLTYA